MAAKLKVDQLETVDGTGIITANNQLTVNNQLTATSFAGDGSNLTALNATNLGSGTVPTARLGTGTADSSVHLRGDGTWAEAGGRCVYSGWDNAHKQTGVGAWQIPTLNYHYQNFDTNYCSAYSTNGIQCDKAGHYMVRLRVMMNTNTSGGEFQTRILISGAQAGYTYDCTPGSKWQTQTLTWSGALTTSDYVQGAAFVNSGSSYFVWHNASGSRYSAIDLIYLGS